MKANEFRIGNYIHRLDLVSGEPRIESIIELHENKSVCTGPFKVNLSYDDLQPIPLTEEWLIKFWFEKINHIHGYSFYTLSKSKKHSIHIDIYENKTVYMGYTIKKCAYVHQLQNLYFALTGEELTLDK